MSKKKAIDHDIIKYDDTIKDESGLKPIDFRFLANVYCDNRFAHEVKKGLHNRLFAA